MVCGFDEVMATLPPTSALSSVDLPALGRPTIETKPETCPSGMRLCFPARGFRARDANPVHAQLIAGQHFDSYAFALHGFAGAWDVSKPFGDQSSDGGGFGVRWRAKTEQVVEPVQVQTAGDDVRALAGLGDVAIGFVLVVNFAEDLLHHVLHGDQARGV